MPARRIYTKTNCSNKDETSSLSQKLREDVLSNFGEAFSNYLSNKHVANIEPVEIKLKDPDRKPPNRKVVRALPYNILGDSEDLIKSLLHAGVIEDCKEEIPWYASSNFLRKHNGQGVRLMTDFWSLNSNVEILGWPFFSSTELQKNILPASRFFWTLDFLSDYFQIPAYITPFGSIVGYHRDM